MKSQYIRAICLGAAGLLVISTAAINNHKQSEDVTAKAVATASVIEESAETVDGARGCASRYCKRDSTGTCQ